MCRIIASGLDEQSAARDGGRAAVVQVPAVV